MKTSPTFSSRGPHGLSYAALACMLLALLPCGSVSAAAKPQLSSYVHATLQEVSVTLAHTGGSVPTMNWDGAMITVGNGAAVAKLNLQAPELITGILMRNNQVALPLGYQVGYAGPPGKENAPIRATMSSLPVPGDPFETYTEIFFGYEAGQTTQYQSISDFPSLYKEDQFLSIRSGTYDANTGILTINATADFLGYDPTPGIGMFLATATIQIKYTLVEKLSVEILALGENVEVLSEDGSFDPFIMPDSNIVPSPVRIEGNARIITGIESTADVRFLSGPNNGEQHLPAYFILSELSDVTINELKKASSEDSIRTRLWLKAGEINAEVNRYQGGPRSDFSVKTGIATASVRGTAFKISHSVALNKTTCRVFDGGPVDIQGQIPELAGMLMTGDSVEITPTTLTGTFFETVHPRAQGYKAEFFSHVDTPAGIALEADGDLLVLDDSSGNVTRITPTGTASAYFTATVPVSGWFGPLLRADGTAVAAHGDDGKVYQISTLGARTLFATVPDPVTGIALKADGDLITTSTKGKLHQISSGGVVTELLTGLVDPSHPTIGADGLVYLIEGNPTRLARINGAAVQNVAAIASAPQMLAQVPGFGLVFGQGEEESFDASSLSTVNTATGDMTEFAGQFSFISGIAGGTTLYYVADPIENSITKITPLQPGTPALSMDTSVLAFGDVSDTTTSALKSVTLTNSGTGNLSVTGISSTSAAFTPAHAVLPIVLAPGASSVVQVTFATATTTRMTATLNIVSDDPADATRQVRMDGTGPNALAPEIVVEQPVGTNIADGSGKDFGGVILGANTSLEFTIENTGGENLTGLTITKDGANSGDFTVTANPTAPVSGPDGSTTFTVQFAPGGTGLRTAELHIENNDSDENPFDITLSGTGRITSQAVQTLAFTPPAKVYLTESPLTLSASASSGLPVVFTVVSGPGSVSGNVLTLTGPGTVKVRASQAGNADFLAAAPVERTITVAANPTTLTLTNLIQTYTGTPRAITAMGTGGAVNVTYKVGLNYVPDAPTNAGSYPVKAVAGAITKTGSLVINKAPLFVQPNDQRKFAGQANPVLGFSYSGFLDDDNAANSVSKAPVIATTASATSVGGLYPITASGGTSANYLFVYLKGTMKVETFAASYEALLVDAGTQRPAAKLELTVAASSKAFTAKLTTPTETAAVALNGMLGAPTINETVTGTATVKKGTNTYLVTVTLPLTGDFTAEAKLNGNSLCTATNGKKLLTLATGQTLSYIGAHSALLAPATVGTGVPVGAGWAVATIDAKGLLKLTGKLGDGTAWTSTLAADASSNPGYRLFVQPYTPARSGTYIAGAFALKAHPDLPGRRIVAYEDAANLIWVKAPRQADTSYRAGFGPVSTRFTLDPWQPPAAAKGSIPAVTLNQRLGLTANQFTAEHSTITTSLFGDLPTTLALSVTNVVSVMAPVTTPANSTKWKVTLTPATGSFAGSFELSDSGKKRLVPFTGVLRQPPSTDASGLIGDGSFQLPSLNPAPDNEILSGEVGFQR